MTEPTDPELADVEVFRPESFVAWDPEAFVGLEKPEASPLTAEEFAAMDPEKRAALEAGAVIDWDAHVRRAHEAPQTRPLPRHRPPRFKDPEAKTAPHLPPNIFGAPRAVR